MSLKKLVKVATGAEKADLVIKNATVADVLGVRFIKGDVAIVGEYIAGVGEYSGKKEVDGSGKYVIPSFYDTHLHFESVMVRPSEYLKIAIPKGVTAFNADPHEIANVCGEEGVRFMVEDTRSIPSDINFMMPSCVPAAPEDRAGCTLNASSVHAIADKYKLFGLGEMMNYPGVINADEDVLSKIDGFGVVDGHAPMLSGNALNGYIAAGIRTDHECETVEEALEKISKGVYVMLREGSQTKNLAELVKAVNPSNLRRFLFCTDDRNLEDLVNEGTIGNCIRLAVQNGLKPIEALTIATINAYEAYGLPKRGAVIPGFFANIIIAEDELAQKVDSVYYKGEQIAENGKPLFRTNKVDAKAVRETVHIKPFKPEELELEFKSGMPVMRILPKTVVTKLEYADTKDGLNLMCCIERHHASGEIGKCFVKGFNLKGCAVAQTVGHDSHNITVLGDNTVDMAKAVECLGSEGGLAVVSKGKVLAYLPLEIGGLMADSTAEDALKIRSELRKIMEQMEYNKEVEPFMLLSFLSLIVIPEVKLNTKGLFDVMKWDYLYKNN